MLTIPNRLLNEVSRYMQQDGYEAVAKKSIDPIVTETASRRQVDATIEDAAVISNVQFFLGKMKKDFGYRVEQHLRKMITKVLDPETKGRRKTIGAA